MTRAHNRCDYFVLDGLFSLQQDDFVIARLAMEEGISQTYMDNDMILLSKDDPNVRIISATEAEHVGLLAVLSCLLQHLVTWCININQSINKADQQLH